MMSEELNTVSESVRSQISALHGLVKIPSAELSALMEKSITPPLVETQNSKGSVVEAPATETPIVQGQNTETQSTETQSTETTTPEVEFKNELGTFEIESPLTGKKVISNSSEEEKPFSFESVDAVSAFFKEKHGLEDVGSLPVYLEDLKQKAETSSALSVQLGNIEKLFSSLPKELYSAVEAFTKGQDWKSAVATPKVDFSKSSSDIDDKSLVEAFFEGKITESDWEEFSSEDGDPNVKRFVKEVVSNARQQFDLKQAEMSNFTKAQIQKEKDFEVSFNSSLESSKKVFLQHFPTAESSLGDEIEGMFKNNSILGLFYNADGSVKEDAYSRIATAMHGGDLIEKYKNIAEKKVETKLREEMLSRTSDSPTAAKGGSLSGRTEEIRPEVQRKIDEINSLSRKSVF